MSMEKKYIDVEAFNKKIGRTTLIDCISPPPSTVQILNILADFPAADVQEVKHGGIIMTGRKYPYCSECDGDLEHTNYRWCPWCDAKMDGGENNEP